MNEFIMHYGVSLICLVIGGLLVFATYYSMFHRPSGVPFVGGIIIAIGFLTCPIKWLALLGLVDPGWFMIILMIIENKQYENAVKGINSIIDAGYLTTEELPDELKGQNILDVEDRSKLIIHIPENEDEKLEWVYGLNHTYMLQHPKVYFAICMNKKGQRYLLVDRMDKTKTVEAMPFDQNTITIKGLKDRKKEKAVYLEVKDAEESHRS